MVGIRKRKAIIGRSMGFTIPGIRLNKLLDRVSKSWDTSDCFEMRDYKIPHVEPVLADALYTVAKKSTGEVIGTFNTLDEANAVIEKAKKQKKAVLQLA